MKEVTQQLFLRRRELGVSQEELAKALKVTPGGVSHWERGTRFPKFETLDRWADYLGFYVEVTLVNK